MMSTGRDTSQRFVAVEFLECDQDLIGPAPQYI